MPRLEARTLAALVALVTACSGTPVARAPVPSVQRANVSTMREASARMALGGACVDPRVDARARLGADADEAGLSVETPFDLDGDGVADPYVSHSVFCGTGGCAWELYVQRDGCAVHVAELFGGYPAPTKTRTFGLFELELAVHNGCAGLARTELSLAFDGKRFVPFRRRDCACPAPTDDSAPARSADVDPDSNCSPWHPASARDLP